MENQKPEGFGLSSGTEGGSIDFGSERRCKVEDKGEEKGSRIRYRAGVGVGL